ncbi:hypothetical protein Acy02nite_50830 [Actinoplanes cyaneus]|uniref:Fibronectin type-III domain-containing protein n=1 Tax=Actinoplanes cyaneus TaxID=52696 RepID=A0A919IMT4_9ACTN|nr:fibronectin type III domain-containing protein [Actinoplanes cyaneus]MCW2141141.1 hypothetical protein [Actinoplanes cyaneus]GID67202.1 hypothetical protein Acy02nite_50830 [Actinoplanes cyaneus]
MLTVLGAASASVVISRAPQGSTAQGRSQSPISGQDSDDGSMAGITATTCAELAEQLLERDGYLELGDCRDEGATSGPPTLSPEDWEEAIARAYHPVRLGSRLVEGHQACGPDAKRITVDTTTPSLAAVYLNQPRFGFKFEYRMLDAGQSTIVVAPSPSLITEVEAGQTYQWRVRALRETGWSTWCEFTVKS